MLKSTGRLPVRPDVQFVTGHRSPTAWEIKFGHGATHYKTFEVELCVRPDRTKKAWIKCPVDGLRYSLR